MCKPTDFSIEGKVIEKYEKAFLLETDTSDKILCNCPKNYDISQLEINDKITVYFNGKILETYPAQIKKQPKSKIIKNSCKQERRLYETNSITFSWSDT